LVSAAKCSIGSDRQEGCAVPAIATFLAAMLRELLNEAEP
jgi:hypothetical protein